MNSFLPAEKDKEFAVNGKQKDSVREETNAVSCTKIMNVKKPTPKTAPSSEAGVRLGRPIDSRAETS